MAEIKIYGTLVNMTTDQKLALTRQLYDGTLEKFQDVINKETKDNINTINESISSITSNLETIIVDNLTSDDPTKALSAKQGKILKSLIDAIKSFSIIVLQEGEDLPEAGNPNTIYFKKKEGSDKDVYNEYIYIETAWELIGSTEVDLSNYYTKDQVYTKSEVDSKLSDAGSGDVVAASEFTTENRVIVSNGAGKVVKDSGVLIENLALKSYVDEKEISWDKVTGKPETYPPSEHKHNIVDINDFPEIPEPIQVDSELSSSSENPVQNKVIDAALKNKLDSTALENYYNKEEIDSKISAAGGGDVVASGNLTDGYIVLGAGTKSIRDSFTRIEDLATQSWVNEQNYITSADITWDNIQNKPNLTEVIYIPLSILYMNEETSSEDIEKAFTDLNTTFDNIYNSLSRENVIYRGVTTLPSSTIMTNLAINVYNQNEGTTKALSFVINDVGVGIKVTISLTDNIYKVTESVNSSYLTEIKKATSGAIGGIKLGYVEADNNIAVNLNEEDRAYITINKNAIVSALGFTPIDSGSIPTTLPNPYPIKFTGLESITYDGSSEVTVNIPTTELNQTSSDELITSLSGGQLFRYTSNTALSQNITLTNFSEKASTAILIIPADLSANFSSLKGAIKKGEDPIGTSDQIKVYTVQYVIGDLYLINSYIYK